MDYKVGMILRAKRDYERHVIGDLFRIESITSTYNLTAVNRLDITYTWSSSAMREYWDIVKRNETPPKNDIEWLDRVQENFKYG